MIAPARLKWKDRKIECYYTKTPYVVKIISGSFFIGNKRADRCEDEGEIVSVSTCVQPDNAKKRYIHAVLYRLNVST
jgi:hypothetical protein